MSTDRWVRALRERASPFESQASVICERERRPAGGWVDATTVFLRGKECPFSCVFCDLWRGMLQGPTPPGSVPAQLEVALGKISHRSFIKLYNASSFFDPLAVPSEDDPAILKLLRTFEQVTVESHPSLVGERCVSFALGLEGRLEVAMGLETTQPRALAALNKRMTVADFDGAAAVLRSNGIGIRAFVLFGTPYIDLSEQEAWTLRSIEHAAVQGAGVVSIIPVRGGNGALEELATLGSWSPVTLEMTERLFARALALDLGDTVVQVDVWDLERLATCPECFPARRARLEEMNRRGCSTRSIECSACGRT